MTIKTAFPNEFNLIQSIAEATWPVTYAEILSQEQLDYMMQMMYSIEALNQNHEDGVQFILAEENGEYFGFSGFQHDYKDEKRTHIHKIYVLPLAQGKNVGRQLMQFMEQKALEHGSQKVSLNVNRDNKAQHFYAKLGYEIAETVDIEIGNGYLMEDFVLAKNL
ncbi:GNAT family N-acetyltransferase [Flavobacterium sp.]|uniref:GNAT family N-acetyltransferase n=1 Tax=Flavobacterium sp. TaxID=239 RepID=UPI001204F18D|nr:GNAT family N-acetyltransferase [Flavobacterium sp.]RZJ71111.1 MAG: GNAT family N-acetyltransferase [Flavobacterium sp.]